MGFFYIFTEYTHTEYIPVKSFLFSPPPPAAPHPQLTSPFRRDLGPFLMHTKKQRPKGSDSWVESCGFLGLLHLKGGLCPQIKALRVLKAVSGVRIFIYL